MAMLTFKNQDGDTITVVARYIDLYGHGEYRVTDVLIKPYKKRKEISLAARIRDDYAYRVLDQDGRRKYAHDKFLEYCTQEQLDRAVQLVYESMAPNPVDIVYWIG